MEGRLQWEDGEPYINVEQLPTDGRVASVLCVGGPVKYKTKPGLNLMWQFIKDCVIPQAAQS